MVAGYAACQAPGRHVRTHSGDGCDCSDKMTFICTAELFEEGLIIKPAL